MKEPQHREDPKMQTLIARLQRGDRQAIALLYDQYGEAIYGIIRRIIPSEEVAREVLQDVFIKVWQKSGYYDPTKGRLFTWLANIARNTAIDTTRTAAFKKQTRTDHIDKTPSEQTQTWTEESKIRDIGLERIIEALDEKHRILIDLAYYKGYTQSEIEQELNIPLGTIKSRLRSAIRQLRKILGTDPMVIFVGISCIFELIRSIL